MTVMKLEKGQYLAGKGEPMNAVHILLKGSVTLKTEYSSLKLESGSVIGLMAGVTGFYECDYVTNEECMLASYSYESPDDYNTIFEEQPQYGYAFLHAALTQAVVIMQTFKRKYEKADTIADFITQQINEYDAMCMQSGFEALDMEHMEELQLISLPEYITDWEMNYIADLLSHPKKNLSFFYKDKKGLCIGEIIRIASDSRNMLANLDALSEYFQKAKEYLICENEDLVELWYDLSMKLAENEESYLLAKVKVHELQEFLESTGLFTKEEVVERIRHYNKMDFDKYVLTQKQAEKEKAIAKEQVQSVAMSPEQILTTDITTHVMKYAGFGEEDIAKCKHLLKLYDTVAETGDTSNEAQRVRKELTALYYDMYEKAFFRTVKEKKVDSILELFFQFGILDIDLAGKENVAAVIPVLEQLKEQQKKQKEDLANGVMAVRTYTIYQWLCMIYHGEKEPSKNEFDVDYSGDLLEQRKQHRITREQENILKHDQDKKVQFEINNLFRNTNRATSGRITTFCPIFHKKDFIRNAEDMLITTEKAQNAIDDIRLIDYSCFYREVFFVDQAHGIERAEIMKEVMPELILMPNIGSRAMMWQETAGVKRDTPARFVFPIMTIADFAQMMLEVVGRYRWEICRKIMGVRWNDIREKSLTSEFYDYVQFYRKNRELSAQAKEKVKADLVHAKNNYREVFVSDYVSWMKYEAQGSVRLNKVSRKIISDYVPFAKATRAKLTENPMFRDLFAQSEILRKRRRDKEKLLFDRYQDAGGEITPEIETHLQFFDM